MKTVSDVTVAETVAAWLSAANPEDVPPNAADMARRLFVDVSGLCVAAGREPYVAAMPAATDGGGACTAIGHAGGFDAFVAAVVIGTAAHGEDVDETFEGAPV